jgi:phosphoketolase
MKLARRGLFQGIAGVLLARLGSTPATTAMAAVATIANNLTIRFVNIRTPSRPLYVHFQRKDEAPRWIASGQE